MMILFKSKETFGLLKKSRNCSYCDPHSRFSV